MLRNIKETSWLGLVVLALACGTWRPSGDAPADRQQTEGNRRTCGAQDRLPSADQAPPTALAGAVEVRDESDADAGVSDAR